jgi:type I restriction enzyme S subunit
MREARLGDVVVSMKNGLYKPASEYADDGTPCLRMYNIGAGSILWRDIKRMRVSAAELEEYGLREGDLLVNRVNSRELVGKAACIPPSLEPSVFESKNIRVRLDASKVLPKFINYQLLSGGRRHFAGNAQQVVGMASISQKQLADFPIVLTDLDEQGRVVAELEKQFSRLDEAVANLKRVKANLKRYKAAVLQSAVDGQLFSDVSADAESPSTWVWGTCGDVIESIEAGASFKCVERPPIAGEVGVLKVSAVTWGEFAEDESKTCLDPTRIKKALFIRPGDFLFSRANTIELVGACVIAKTVTKSLMLSDKILRFRLAAGLAPEWLLLIRH